MPAADITRQSILCAARVAVAAWWHHGSREPTAPLRRRHGIPKKLFSSHLKIKLALQTGIKYLSLPPLTLSPRNGGAAQPQKYMADLIEASDRTYSTKGSEWHGLARVPLAGNGQPVETLTADILKDILFPVVSLDSLSGVIPGTGMPDGLIPPDARAELMHLIALAEQQTHMEAFRRITGDISALINGTAVPVPGVTVAADLRARGEGVRPLATHSERYGVITNGEIFHALTAALAEFPHKITTAGTLSDCAKFYISAELIGNEGFNVGGDTFLSQLCMVTSHNGSLALQAYDANTRPICWNTVRQSLAEAKHRIHIKHTRNAGVRLEGVAAWINDVLHGREEWSNSYSRAKNTPVRKEDALALIASFFSRNTGTPEAMSTRTRNAVDSVFNLFERGKGNDGSSIGDVLNGFTDHYSNGAGVGETRKGQAVTALEKRITGLFGGAADTKSEVSRILLSPDGKEYEELVAHAPQALASYARGAGMPTPVYMSGLDRTRAVSGTYGQRAITPAVPVAPASGASDFEVLLSGPFAPKV